MFNQKDRLQHAWIRKALGRSIPYPTHWLPATQGFLNACLAGMAWSLNLVQLVKGHLASGRLVELISGAFREIPLFWQVSRLAAERLSDLSRSVVTTAKRELALSK